MDIEATLAANVAHGVGYSLPGTGVAAWPAVALVRVPSIRVIR
jgi:hypothetical protein